MAGKRSRPSDRPNLLQTWLLRHAQVALASLGRLFRAPVGTLMTSMVIGIAVCLPAGMWAMLDNVRQLSGSLDGAASISVFVKNTVTDEELQTLHENLGKLPEVSSTELISRQQALDEFRQFSGFGRAIDILQDNPLPAVIVVIPAADHGTAERAPLLLKRIEQEAGVDFAQLDLEWVRRFHAITDIAVRAVVILASVLGLAVLLIIGNTIRLEIQNRHDEIAITKLIGATNAFIRRPFLYMGFWFGLLGGITAWLLVSLSLWLLSGPISSLTGLYQSEFRLDLLGFAATLLIVLGSAVLGLIGARIAVGRHLDAIEPE
jgi:cell division transport system permease protein